MYHSLISFHFHSDLTECNLAVPPVKCPHDTFRTFCISCHDAKHLAEIYSFKLLMDALINCQWLIVVEPAKVNKACIDTIVVENIDRVPARVSLTDGCQYFTCSQMYLGGFHISRGKHFP